ncbi:MAG: hypothetical protein LBC73_08995 [Oscillospiraceae bacterium]|jgi:hypothetical protein|nr:hypothetical protein [Oscillospiraceae bacterium]
MNEITNINHHIKKPSKKISILIISILLIVLNLPLLIFFINVIDFSGIITGEDIDDFFLPILYSMLTAIYVGIIGLIFFRKINRLYICFYLGIFLVVQIAISSLYYFVLGIIFMGAQGLYTSFFVILVAPFCLTLPVLYVNSSKTSKTKEKKSFKQIILLLLFPVIIATFSLINFAPLFAIVTSDFEYRGDYPELYTTAQNSLLGQNGYIPDHHVPHGFDPYLEVLEIDNYGRVLFTYSEQQFQDQRYGYALLIVQKVDDEYVYFYPHYNFVISLNHRDWSAEYMVEFVNELKEANSWNQELSDINKFERIKISRQKETSPIPDRQLISAYRNIFADLTTKDGSILYNDIHFFRTDDFGQSIYLFNEYVIFFNVDHRVKDILDISDLYRDIELEPAHSMDLRLLTYQTELRLFMKANGWNRPSISS